MANSWLAGSSSSSSQRSLRNFLANSKILRDRTGLRSDSAVMAMQDEAVANSNMNDSADEDGIYYTEEGVPVHTLYLGNIPRNKNQQQIKLHFSKFGNVESVNIVRKKMHDSRAAPYQFGFITFTDPKSAASALSSGMHKSFAKNMKVKPAHTWKQPKSAQQSKIKQKNTNNIEKAAEIEGECLIMNLNDDCMLQIFSYLEQNDVLKLASLCVRFQNLVADNMKTRKRLDLTDAHEDFSLKEVKQILEWFGEDIKAIAITWYDSTYFRYLDFIARYCHNLEELDLNLFERVRSKIYKRIFQASKNLKILSLVECDLTNQDCFLIGEYLQVHTLNLSGNGIITGEHLCKSKHVVDLNLSHCDNLDLSHFNAALMELKLKRLSIVGCYHFTDGIFENILKAQKDLESITISNAYSANRLRAVGKLNLKHIRIHHASDYNFPYEILTELAQHRKNDMESLELYRIPTNTEERYRNTITAFPCLKKLCIVKDETLDNYCLERISKACKLLEVVNVAGALSITIEGVLELVLNLPNLKSLNISHCPQIQVEAIQQIYNVLESRQTENAAPLTLCVHDGPFLQDDLMIEAANKYRKLLKLTFEIDSFFDELDVDDEFYDDILEHLEDDLDSDFDDDWAHEFYYGDGDPLEEIAWI